MLEARTKSRDEIVSEIEELFEQQNPERSKALFQRGESILTKIGFHAQKKDSPNTRRVETVPVTNRFSIGIEGDYEMTPGSADFALANLKIIATKVSILSSNWPEAVLFSLRRDEVSTDDELEKAEQELTHIENFHSYSLQRT